MIYRYISLQDRKMSNFYVYLVRRKLEGLTIHCTDLVGKVGKGSGDRKNAYRTPYGSDNLIIDIWTCDDERDALVLESTIHDILDLLGWLRYHAPSGKNKHRNRAEVVSFPFKGKDQESMIKEYTRNMQWIHDLIQHHHHIRTNPVQVLNLIKGKIKNGIMPIGDLPLFDSLPGNTTSQKMKVLFQTDITITRCNQKGIRLSTGDHVFISLSGLYKERKGCSIM